MKNTLTTLSFCIFLISNLVLSQEDIIADQKPFGLIFLDGQKYPDCKMCNLIGDEKRQIDEVEEKIENLSPKLKVQKLEKLLLNDYADNVKARIAMTLARIKYEEIISDDQMNYNLNESGYFARPNYSLSHKEIDGTLDVLSWFDKALSFAVDSGSKSYLKRGRMQYILQEGIYDAIMDDKTIYESSSLIKNIAQLKNKPNQKRILQLLNEDYVETGYNPFHSYTGVNTGLIYSYGKDSWIGGNLGITLVENKNVFQNVARFSLISFSWQHNLNTSTNDISFDLLKFDHLGFFNLNITQFGFHQGLPGVDGVKWFYRPEIGLSYGPFSVGYAYNLTFKKDVRYLTEKNMFIAKLAYPLIRISKYN
jgi:hypothetical protein